VRDRQGCGSSAGKIIVSPFSSIYVRPCLPPMPAHPHSILLLRAKRLTTEPRHARRRTKLTPASPFQVTKKELNEIGMIQKIKYPEKLSKEKLEHSLGFKNSHEVALALQKALGTDRLRSSAGTWQGFDGDYNTYRRPQLEEEALLEGLDIWFAP